MGVEASPDAELIQAFVNTRDLRSFVPRGHPHRDGTRDDVATPTALGGWLAERGLLSDGTDVTERDHADVMRLRTALRTALDRSRHPAEDPGTGPYAVSLQVEIDADEGPRLTTPDEGIRRAIGQLCAAAVRIAVSGEWWRLRVCAADDCQLVFYDQSRPGRGRYCSPYSCGNRVKTRAYRQRKTETPDHSA